MVFHPHIQNANGMNAQCVRASTSAFVIPNYAVPSYRDARFEREKRGAHFVATFREKRVCGVWHFYFGTRVHILHFPSLLTNLKAVFLSLSETETILFQ
jgi:hypothetical protein